jgi:hypothetical protein
MNPEPLNYPPGHASKYISAHISTSSITGKPTEVMGYLIGRQCTEDPTTMIITDAQPLPIEGFETSVVADTEEVTVFQIKYVCCNSVKATRHG